MVLLLPPWEKTLMMNGQTKGQCCYLCGGNHYSNTCDQKKENGDNKKKKAGHLHLTTDSDHYHSDNDADEDFGDWESVTLGEFMFHQHSLGLPRKLPPLLHLQANGQPQQIICYNSQELEEKLTQAGYCWAVSQQ
eukprot:15350723-Ditylum_brightwellii.AAC.1